LGASLLLTAGSSSLEAAGFERSRELPVSTTQWGASKCSTHEEVLTNTEASHETMHAAKSTQCCFVLLCNYTTKFTK